MDIAVPMSRAIEGVRVNVTVTGLRRWNLRMRLALWCFRLGALVAPVHVTIETHTPKDVARR